MIEFKVYLQMDLPGGGQNQYTEEKKHCKKKNIERKNHLKKKHSKKKILKENVKQINRVIF